MIATNFHVPIIATLDAAVVKVKSFFIGANTRFDLTMTCPRNLHDLELFLTFWRFFWLTRHEIVRYHRRNREYYFRLFSSTADYSQSLLARWWNESRFGFSSNVHREENKRICFLLTIRIHQWTVINNDVRITWRFSLPRQYIETVDDTCHRSALCSSNDTDCIGHLQNSFLSSMITYVNRIRR